MNTNNFTISRILLNGTKGEKILLYLNNITDIVQDGKETEIAKADGNFVFVPYTLEEVLSMIEEKLKEQEEYKEQLIKAEEEKQRKYIEESRKALTESADDK